MKQGTKNYVSKLDYKIIVKYLLTLINQVWNRVKQKSEIIILPSFIKYQHVSLTFKRKFSKCQKVFSIGFFSKPPSIGTQIFKYITNWTFVSKNHWRFKFIH
jgi:hypothetical protein